MTIESRVEKCRFMIKGIINSYFVSDQNLKLLTPLLNDKSVYSIWDHTEGVDGVAAIRMALYSHILSDMRAIMFDYDKKVASMHNIISCLEDNGCAAKLKDDFCKPTGVTVCGDHSEDEEKSIIASVQKEDREQKSHVFDERIASVTAGYQALKKSELGIRVDTARSKMISHKQITSIDGERKLFNAEDFGLKFSDAGDFMEEAKEVIFGANLLLTNSSYHLDEFIGHHDTVSEIFWNKCKNA